MSGHELPGIPGLLDVDLQLFLSDLPALPDFQIAPLRNPAPARQVATSSAPESVTYIPEGRQKLEPQGGSLSGRNEALGHPSLSQVKPGDTLSAREEKKPHLAISELVERNQDELQLFQLPSFVSLSVVEKSPIQHASEINHPRKRLRLETDMEPSSVELNRVLPRPAKKDEKKTRPVPLLPAMVTGLHEPPPSAGLLPSMSDARPEVKNAPIIVSKAKMDVKEILTESQQASNRRPPEAMLNAPDAVLPVELPKLPKGSVAVENEGNDHLQDDSAAYSEKVDVKARRQRRKWSKAETAYLQDGVKKYGTGRWKQILGDPSYKFDNRTAVDLKDRYRVFAKEGNDDQLKRPVKEATHLGNATTGPTMRADSGLTVQRKKRQPWTKAEDAALVKGVSKHGFHWSAIQSDPDFAWGSRRATDLRDRIRTLYPEGYKKADIRPLAKGHLEEAHVTDKNRAQKESMVHNSIEHTVGSMQRTDPIKSTARGLDETQGQPSSIKINAAKDGQLVQQQFDQTGVTLPSLALDNEDDAFAWDNRLPPLLDWEELGV